MRKIKLTSLEKEIEQDLLKGKFIPANDEEFRRISESIKRRRKDAVISLRVNSVDLEHIKQKARKLGLKYQTLVSELIHRVAVL